MRSRAASASASGSRSTRSESAALAVSSSSSCRLAAALTYHSTSFRAVDRNGSPPFQEVPEPRLAHPGHPCDVPE